MQYENNLRKNVLQRERKKKQDLVFQKVHLEKGGSSYNQGRLIFGLLRYYIFVPEIHSSSGTRIIPFFWIKSIPILLKRFEQHKLRI